MHMHIHMHIHIHTHTYIHMHVYEIGSLELLRVYSLIDTPFLLKHQTRMELHFLLP